MFKNTKVKKMFEADDPRLVFYLKNKNITLSEIFKDDEDLIEKSIRYHKNTIAETAITYSNDLDRVNSNHQSYLMLAILYDNLSIFKILLEKEVKLDDTDVNRESLIYYIAGNPNNEYFELIINYEIDVKGFNLKGESPLIYAYTKGRKDICLYILGKNVLVNHLDKDGNTILHYALNQNDIEFALLLIEYGADIFIKNYQDISPLDIAKLMGIENQVINKVIETVNSLFELENNEEIEELLVEHDDNNNFTEFNLMFLIAVFSVKFNNKVIFEKIWRKSKLLNNIDYRGKSLLMYCVEFGAFIFARKIIYLESNLNLIDNDNKTVLFYVLERLNHYKNDKSRFDEYLLLFDELLERKINVNNQDINGNTILLTAIKDGQKAVIDKLIEYPNINLNIMNNDGKTALLLTYEMRDYRSFHNIIASRKAAINTMDKEQNTIMLLTLIDDNIELFDLLLQFDADLNLQYKDGLTLLMIAINKQKKRFIAKIFEHLDFDYDIQDDSGKTALMHAITNRDIRVVEALLKCGADVNVEDNNGDTAMYYALSIDDFDIARIIKTYTENKELTDDTN